MLIGTADSFKSADLNLTSTMKSRGQLSKWAIIAIPAKPSIKASVWYPRLGLQTCVGPRHKQCGESSESTSVHTIHLVRTEVSRMHTPRCSLARCTCDVQGIHDVLRRTRPLTGIINNASDRGRFPDIYIVPLLLPHTHVIVVGISCLWIL